MLTKIGKNRCMISVWKLAKILWEQNFFLHLWDINLDREVEIIWGEQYLLLHFHYFIPIETVNTQ